ncbi:type IV pilus assembly protein FimV [Vreelandella sp. EE22]
MNKTVARNAWLALTMFSPAALALGLGQPTVFSPLQAPLDATVTLLDTDGYRVEDIGATIAEPSAFNALGLEWSPLLADVQVSPVRQNGRTYLRLSSQQAVNTPWLDVLVTLTTPTGRQTQSVTLLFDPVDYLPSEPSAMPAMAAQSSVPRVGAIAPPPPEAVLSALPGASSETTNTTVRPGDTLWDIALRTRPPGVDVQQMIAALVEANPEAFAGRSIDRLNVGQRLRLPSRQEALNLSPGQAAQTVRARSAQTSDLPSPNERSTAQRQDLAQRQEVAQNQAARGESNPQAAEVEGSVLNVLPSEAVLDPASLDAALAVSDANGMRELDSDNEVIPADTLAQIVTQWSPMPTALAAPNESEFQLMLEEQARQAEEIDALRREVAELRQALGDVQTFALSQNDALPIAAQTSDGSSSLADIVREYWAWLAGLGLALLLAAMMITRRRRERRWEPAPLASTSQPPLSRAVQSAPMVASRKPEPEPEPEPEQTPAQDSKPDETSALDTSVEVSAVNETPAQDETQAFSLAARVQAHEPTLKEEGVSDERALEDPSLVEREPVSSKASWWGEEADDVAEPGQAAREPVSPLFLDEQEPPLSAKPSRPASSHTIDYQPEHFSTPADPAAHSSSSKAASMDEQTPFEPEWEIEEVAFKPRRRDNG